MQPISVKILILSAMSVGGFDARDVIDEGQLFYNEYLAQGREYALKNGKKLYYSEENGIAVSATGVGKANAASHLATILSDPRFDCSQAYLMSVGCGGGAAGSSVFGDVTLALASVDRDIGHTADIRDLRFPDSPAWFRDPVCDPYSHFTFCEKLIRALFERVKDLPMRTTPIAERTLRRNFPGQAWASRKPKVLLGTTLTGDNYWKGSFAHQTSEQIVRSYQTPAPYTVTEMEETALAAVASQFGLLERMIVLRGAVNLDVFLDGECPESQWSSAFDFADAVTGVNAETLDVFVPVMENVFTVGRTIITALLRGSV